MRHRRSPFSVRLPANLVRLLSCLRLSPQAFLLAALDAYLAECPYILALCDRKVSKHADERYYLESLARRIWLDRHSHSTILELQSLRYPPMSLLKDQEIENALDEEPPAPSSLLY